MQPLRLYVNGKQHDLVIDPLRSLLDVLRTDLGLCGTKEGCGTGYCGACTVLVDDRPVNACLLFAVDADHRPVTTIEGLADGDALHPLQESFVKHTATQCGFCTPGMILSAYALLQENPAPSEDEVRAGLAGNLCRCTGYQLIVEAVRDVAPLVSGEKQRRQRERPPVRSRA